MELGNWESTADLNPIYAEIRRLDLERCIAELDAFGFTVIPPDRVAPREFHDRLLKGILTVHERRSGQRVAIEDLPTATLPGDRPLATYWSLIGEDPVFEEALLNPVVTAMARYMCGKNAQLSDSIALVKRRDDTPTHLLHIDQAGTPPPLPAYQQVINITWALTDYTRPNGCVAIVPGSHRFGHMPMPYEENFLSNEGPVKAIPVECEPGSLIIWGGTTWHGSYPRTADGLRVNLIQVFCRPYMKTVRDFRGEIPEEVVRRNGPEFAQLIGLNSLYPIDKDKPFDMKARDRFLASGLNQWG
jgi:hypothetical protein